MKKALSILLVFSMLLCILCACSTNTTSETVNPAESSAPQETAAQSEVISETGTETGAGAGLSMPLTEEPVTLSYFMRFNPQASDWCQDMSDNYFYKELEEISNVHIDFQLLHPSVFIEQFNLQVASGDYADIYCETGAFYTGGYDKGVDEGVFLDLTDLVKEYAPNYWSILNESEDVMRSGVTDEGRIAFIAQAYDPYQPCNVGPQIRGDWAKALGFDPSEITTYADYEAYIVAANTEYGATVQLPNTGSPNYGYLSAGFGVPMNFGNVFEATLPWYQIDGELKLTCLEDGFREYIELANDWYNRGLIYPDFVSLDSVGSGGADMALVATGSSSLWWAENNYMEQYGQNASDPNFQVTAIQDAVKNKGDVTHLSQTNYDRLAPTSSCVISTTCANPEIAVAWLDYRFSEEGAMLANWGVEGITYEMVDGHPVYTDLIVNNPEGMTATLAQYRYMLQNTVCLTSVEAQQQGLTEMQLEAANIWMTDKDGEWNIPTSLTLTVEESDIYNRVIGDVTTYCQENFLKFITGDRPLNELDSFVQEIKNMGVDQAMEVYQNALSRYYAR